MSAANQDRGRFFSKRKMEAVLRLLIATLSRPHQAPISQLVTPLHDGPSRPLAMNGRLACYSAARYACSIRRRPVRIVSDSSVILYTVRFLSQ